jgi:uncharacterized protein YjbI with pentapeptide repeats
MAFRFRLTFPREKSKGTNAPAPEAGAQVGMTEQGEEDAALRDFLVQNFLVEDSSTETPAAADTAPPAQPPTAKNPEPPAQPPTAKPAPVSKQAAAPSAPPVAIEKSRPAEESRPAPPAPIPPEPPAEVSKELLHAVSSEYAIEEKLASHKEWLETRGATGRKAELSDAKLEGIELIGVSLRYADLHDADLKASDLLLADLRDACLVRANLEEACLVGANLEGANLEGASLESAMGLVPRQLAGANLREATVPAQIREFPALAEFAAASKSAVRLFAATISASLLSCLIIWRTKDFQLLTDSAIIPYLHSPTASAALPSAEFYLIAPALLLCLYLVFQYQLQRLWDAVLELPGIFPDGAGLGDDGPRIVRGLLRSHFRWMNLDPPSTRMIEKGISLLLAYWVVPGTLVLFWARDLTLQEIHSTILQVFLIGIATGVAVYATTKIGRPQEIWTFQKKTVKAILKSWRLLSPSWTTTALCAGLLLLSLGTTAGVPHDRNRAPQIAASHIRRWAPTVFWIFGYDPYADLTEAALSTRPANWTGADDQLSLVRGARLNETKFRYAQGYRAFLVNAHLWRSDFEGAFLSEADLRGADLGQSDLRSAILDRAQMAHTNFDRAELDGANLERADLHGANLSYSSLVDATLVDSRLDGASLYATKLSHATLIRASLEKADLRDAQLDSANLERANMQQTYLWSAKLPGARLENARLANAILIDADLRGADLRGAQFTGTVLNGANLVDTNLDGADLRGALGLSANQVCSAKSRREALLDTALETEVDARCGNNQKTPGPPPAAKH